MARRTKTTFSTVIVSAARGLGYEDVQVGGPSGAPRRCTGVPEGGGGGGWGGGGPGVGRVFGVRGRVGRGQGLQDWSAFSRSLSAGGRGEYKIIYTFF